VHLAETPQPTTEVQRQLDLANSQMALYAHDLKRMVDAERQKAHALAEANARLEILDRLKTDFLAFVAHELRTPLSTMMVVDILDPHDDPQAQAEVIDILRRGYDRLEKFIEKGLEYFHWLVADEQVDTSATTDLAMLVRLVTAGMPDLTEPGIAFQLSTPDVPCIVRGEERHLTTVVQILLDNALKFSEEEKAIQVDVRATEGRFTLTVTDRGQGFSPELGPELFRPFTIAQVMHHSRGTGLNLALAGAIVTAYGGQTRAESAGVGQGATFTVEFPAETLEI
ncbi:MAG: HAMP domain-containing histidine kinase, partial [Deltaproteobacteria bacterium]|nr:HAMP domain-containing histidine kinase [Deltaproteobacteria bacterium]